MEEEHRTTAFKRRCGVTPGTTPDNSSWWSVPDLKQLLTGFQNLRPNQPTELDSKLILSALCSAKQDFLRIIRLPTLEKKNRFDSLCLKLIYKFIPLYCYFISQASLTVLLTSVTTPAAMVSPL